MKLNINNYPNKEFHLIFDSIPFFTFKIDLNQTVKEKLNRGQELTNAVALKIFKQIKCKSDVLAFLTKPIVFIPLSTMVVGFGFFLSVTGIFLVAVQGVIICAVGGFMIGISVREPSNNFLSQLSQAYRDQSRRAAEYIQNLKTSDQEFVFTLT